MNPAKITSEITHGNFGLERVLKELALFAGSSYNPGNMYIVVDSADNNYAQFVKYYQKKYEDMTDMIQTGIQAAIDVATSGGRIYIAPRPMGTGATDPVDWAELLTIAAAQDRLSLIGLSNNRTQGGLPQLKKGSGTTAHIIVRAPGCYIANLGINGASNTGGGILLDDDGSTKTAFGTTIENCHFKNCKGATATNASTGGAVMLSGAPWQVSIKNNKFYKNVGGIVLKDTAQSVPQDVHIEGNSFAGSAAAVDCDIYGAGGSGFGTGLVIRDNDFNVFPALASGANLLWMDLTGADGGIVARNNFADDKTFGAAGTGAKVPTTVFLSGNHDEGGLIARV